MDVDTDDYILQDVVRPTPALPARSPPPPVRHSSEPYHPPRYTVGYVYAIDMMIHISINGHPEAPQRIQRIMEAFQAEDMDRKMKRLPIRRVRREEALLVHSESHWDKVMAIQRKWSVNLPCLWKRVYLSRYGLTNFNSAPLSRYEASGHP